MTIPIPQQVRDAANNSPHPLLFATVSGAHLYGFPSPDSDWDLRGVHILPLRDMIGLGKREDTVESAYDDGDVEMDLVTHDVEKFFRLMLKRNGYVLEQLYSPLVVISTPHFERLKEVAKGCITSNHAHHYLGFAANQWKLFAKSDQRKVKQLLYTYRVLLTGIHLMRTGVVEANLLALKESFGLAFLDTLIERKHHGGEHGLASDEDVFEHEERYDLLVAELENARDSSELPEKPITRDELNHLLIEIRMGNTGRRPNSRSP